MSIRLWCLAPLALAAGCSSDYRGQVDGVPPAPTLPAASAAPVGAVIENPKYAEWKKFPVGTAVTRRAVTDRADNANTVVATETLRLVELDAGKAVIERQKTVERTGEETRTDVAPPERWTVAAAFALPNGMTAEDFRKPSREAKLVGEEKVTTAGTEYQCRKYTFGNGTEAGPMTVTVWYSDDMPGRLVKQTMTVSGVGNRTTEAVVAVTRP